MSKTFYIIDGHAQIFRAYYAPFRELSSPTGEPTKATFVFTQMLLNLVKNRKPDYLAMVIDTGKDDVFRKAIYPEYKANRQAPPPDFRPQADRIVRLVQDSGVKLYGMSGFEADDLIATIAHRLEHQGFDVVIVSKDKDLRQLIDARTRMYDVQADRFTDAQSMVEECGYGPEKSIEVQTLTGDAIDNVQGIPGVGEKTAAKLIAKYGTADAVLQHLDDLTPKMRENFQNFGTRLAMARQLVTLRKDVDFGFEPEACAFSGLNLAGLGNHLRELGFSGLIQKLGLEELQAQARPAPVSAGPASPPPAAAPKVHQASFEHGLFGPAEDEPAAPPAAPSGAAASAGDSAAADPRPPSQPLATSEGCDYRLVNTPEKLEAFLAQLRQQKVFAFDTETDDLGAMKSNLIGMSFSWKAQTGWYLPVRGPEGSQHLSPQVALEAVRPIMEDPAIGKLGHNIKYDLLVMRQAGVDLGGIMMDTMVAAFVLDAGRMQYGIDPLARDLLGFRKIATSELIGKGKNQVSMVVLPLEQVARYAAEDADIAWRLSEYLLPRLAALPALAKLNDELETPLVEVLAEMEFNGIAIDPGMLAAQSKVLGERADELRGQIMTSAGTDFNPDSPRQLADVLFNKLGLKVVKRNKTGPSTDVEVLDKLASEHAVPRMILEYRSLVKLKNTYLDNLTEFLNPRTRRIHASFNQIGAATGRLSCSDPNLQNIPIRSDEGRRIRLAFVPGKPENLLLTADYSQIELRILAHFTEEPALLRAFAADEDVHATVAAEVFGVPLDQVTKDQRGQAKVINFGIIYGISASGLSRRIDGMSIPAAQELINAYNRRFPAIQQFMHQCVMNAQSMGYVQTIMGRRRPIPELGSPVLAQRNAGERMSINSVVQGSAADLIKHAMLNVHRRIKAEDRPCRLLLQVHDELVLETPADSVEAQAEMIRQEMVNAMQLKVPLKVEVGWGKNWEEGKK